MDSVGQKLYHCEIPMKHLACVASSQVQYGDLERMAWLVYLSLMFCIMI